MADIPGSEYGSLRRETINVNPSSSSSRKLGEEYDAAKRKWAAYVDADGKFDVDHYAADRKAGTVPFNRLFKWLPHVGSKIKQDLDCAKEGLAWYNKTHNVNFEFVEAVGSSGFIDQSGQLMFHTNFKAKPKDANSEEKLFFAEIKTHRPGDRVTSCCILEEDEGADADVLNDCRGCVRLRHPKAGFDVGLRPFLLRAPLEN